MPSNQALIPIKMSARMASVCIDEVSPPQTGHKIHKNNANMGLNKKIEPKLGNKNNTKDERCF